MRRNKTVKSALRSMRRDGSMTAGEQKKSSVVKHMKELEEAETSMGNMRNRGSAILIASIAAAFAGSDIRDYLNRQAIDPEVLTAIEPAKAPRLTLNQSYWRP